MRKSNFEILRLIAMFCIVFHHILGKFIQSYDDNILYKALDIPIHFAVALFVLISGYFHIHPTLRGATKLLAPLLVYYFPLTIFELTEGYLDGGIGYFFSFSNFPYWFIFTYFYLYLTSPLLNSYLDSTKSRVYPLLAFGFISVVMGMIQDPSLNTGKNLTLFMFLYIVGDSLKYYKSKSKVIHLSNLVLLFTLFNVFAVGSYYFLYDTIFGKIIWNLCHPYCSPGLIINAVLFFLIFSRLNFSSKIVNYLSGSVFAIYIIHHQDFVLNHIIRGVTFNIYNSFQTPIALLFAIVLLTISIMMVCVVIDKTIFIIYRVIKKNIGIITKSNN